MKLIKYYNPKTNKYTQSKILSIMDDVVTCQNKQSIYTESLKNLIDLSNKPNPNWHGTEKKPLIVLV